MAPKEINYANTEIYKIVPIDESLNFCYVGSTTCFKQRKYQHKSSCINPNNKYYNLKVYQVIRDNGGWDAFKMVFIEKYPCENRRQAEAKEEQLRKELNGNLNMKKSFVSGEEKKEYDKERNKKYYQKNKEKYVCECGSCIILSNKINHENSNKHLEYLNNLEKI